MGDEKVKAEKGGNRIEVSSLLSIDSPMSVWQTDLETLGLGGGGSSSSSGTEGSPTSTGESTSSGGEPAKRQVPTYIATCDAVVHELDVPGAVDDGRWFGSFQSRYEDALAQAQAHEDGSAYVGIYLNGVLVGPVVQH